MARIKYGALVSGVRGHIGGVVFSQSLGGPTAGLFKRSVRRRTLRQNFERSIYTDWGNAWRSLTQAQRDDWNTYASQPAQQKTDAFGDPFFASGFNWFVTINTHLTRVGAPTRDDAPTGGTPAAPTLNALTVTAPGDSGNELTYPAAEFNGFDMVLDGQPLRSLGNTSPQESRWRRIIECQTCFTPTSVDLGDLQAIFGALQAGQAFWVRAYRQSIEGRRSMPVLINTEVV